MLQRNSIWQSITGPCHTRVRSTSSLKHCLLVLGIFLILNLPCLAALQLKTSVDSTRITVGDLLTVKIAIRHPDSVKVAFPDVGNSLGEWTVRQATRLPGKVVEGGTVEDTLELQLTIYKTGEFAVPAVNAEIVSTNGDKSTLSSEPITITVQSVLSGGEETLRGIKPQAEIEADYKPFLFFLAALGSAVYLIYRLIRYLKRRKKELPVLPVDTRSPEETARHAIAELLSRKLVEQGLLKEFYLELSEIMKRFFGAKLAIVSLERTTEEFVRDLRETSISSAQYRMIREFLEECDFVKFAKYRPGGDEVQQIVARSNEMIESLVLSSPVPAEVAK